MRRLGWTGQRHGLRGDGNDALALAVGDDKGYGGNGEDQIIGGFGMDLINGDNGDDNLSGGFNNDTINGGNGDDLLYGELPEGLTSPNTPPVANNDQCDGARGYDTALQCDSTPSVEVVL